MKRTLSTVGVIAAAILCLCCCKNAQHSTDESTDKGSEAIASGSIVYFDLDKVIEGYDFALDLRSEVQAKVDAIEKEVNRRQKKLEGDIMDFKNRIDKGLMTSAAAQAKQNELQQKDADFQRFAQQKQAEVMEEQQVMMNQIADAIKTYVEEYNQDKLYSMILANQAGVPVIAADSMLDITDDIIAGLNARYADEKGKK